MYQYQHILSNCTARAALAAHAWIGKGDEMSADRTAVDAMRATLSTAPFACHIVVGEGERDEAPMLFRGEQLGQPHDLLQSPQLPPRPSQHASKAIQPHLPSIDLAVDPLEGTTICAHGNAGAMSVLAAAPQGCLLEAPDTYMKKLVVGPRFSSANLDIDAPIHDTIKRMSAHGGLPVHELTIAVLHRERHQDLVCALRESGVRVKLIGDGDIAASIATCMPDENIHAYMGIGGAPEGILASVALKTLGGTMQTRFIARNDAERSKLTSTLGQGLDTIYTCDSMVRGNSALLIATGVTDGRLLSGAKRSTSSGLVTFETLIYSLEDRSVNKVASTLYD